jgi:GntR family transcriptional repressor for pyruvate dehydrogenase complex
MYNVSRASVREAIKGLEERGFVERQQGIGIKVINRSIEVASKSLRTMMLRSNASQIELLEVRRIIELQTAKLAAERVDEKDIQLLRETIEIMSNEKSTVSEYIDNDLAFHLLLAKASKNKILESILKALKPLLKEAIELTLKDNSRPELTMHFHKKILQQIINKNPEEAKKCMSEHLEATEKMILDAIKNNQFNSYISYMKGL